MAIASFIEKKTEQLSYIVFVLFVFIYQNLAWRPYRFDILLFMDTAPMCLQASVAALTAIMRADKETNDDLLSLEATLTGGGGGTA